MVKKDENRLGADPFADSLGWIGKDPAEEEQRKQEKQRKDRKREEQGEQGEQGKHGEDRKHEEQGKQQTPKETPVEEAVVAHEEMQPMHTPKKGRGPAQGKTNKKTGCKPGYTRVAYIVKEELVEKVKAHAYWERLSLVDVMEEILEEFFRTRKVKPIPERKKRT